MFNQAEGNSINKTKNVAECRNYKLQGGREELERIVTKWFCGL